MDRGSKVHIDTTFYDERIAYYDNLKGLDAFMLKQYSIEDMQTVRYKGFGSVDFYMNIDTFNWIKNFWKEAKIWYIKMETERLQREQKKAIK